MHGRIRAQKPAVLKNYVQAVIHGVCLMKHRKQEAMSIVAGEPMKRMKIDSFRRNGKSF